MSKRPYASAATAWLVEHETIFRDILANTSRHRADLERLQAVSRGTQDLVAFVGLSDADLATAARVCDQLMDGLAPTANAMRQELEQREGTLGDHRLPVA